MRTKRPFDKTQNSFSLGFLMIHPDSGQRARILAPAGNWETLAAALQAGADAVYFGVGKLNMRAHAARNFQLDELPEIVERCGPTASFLTLNTLIYDEELEEARETLQAARKAGVSGIIAQDVGVMELAREQGLRVHLSTQANVSNSAALRFYARWASAVVLARELTAEQIRHIAENIRSGPVLGPEGQPVELEIFIHGALCIAVSGKCGMSLAHYNTSANRGQCYQSCRRSYRVTDTQTEQELVIDNEYVMSPADLCTIRFLDQLVATGASLLKIEGRGRPPEYVHTTVSVYREALEAIGAGSFTEEAVVAWEERLSRVFNRGFWHGGYYMGRKIGEWAAQHGSQATRQKTYLGKVENYFATAGILQVNAPVAEGDELVIQGASTGVVNCIVSQPRRDGEAFTFAAPRVRRNDKIYRLTPRMA